MSWKSLAEASWVFSKTLLSPWGTAIVRKPGFLPDLDLLNELLPSVSGSSSSTTQRPWGYSGNISRMLWGSEVTGMKELCQLGVVKYGSYMGLRPLAGNSWLSGPLVKPAQWSRKTGKVRCFLGSWPESPVELSETLVPLRRCCSWPGWVDRALFFKEAKGRAQYPHL